MTHALGVWVSLAAPAVKFFRFFLRLLVALLAVFALAGFIALTPPFQSWLLRRAVSSHRGAKIEFNSFWAGFGHAAADDLRIEGPGWVFTTPSLEAKLPLLNALRGKKLALRGVVAKGWVLDLSGPPDSPGSAGLDSVTPAKLVAILRGALTQAEVPWDFSIDDVDLEGDVLLPRAGPEKTLRVHVSGRGGGMGAGKTGSFPVQAEAAFLDGKGQPVFLTFRGDVSATMDTPRRFQRVAATGQLAIKGGALREPLAASIDVSGARENAGEVYAVAISREQRRLAELTLRADAKAKAAGEWKLDVADDDRAWVGAVVGARMPSLTGDGEWKADSAFQQIQLSGSVHGPAAQFAEWIPAIDLLEASTAQALFDATLTGKTVQVERLEIAFATTEPVATVKSAQPFSIDASSGAVSVSDRSREWLNVSIGALPLSRFPSLLGLRLVGTAGSGAVAVRVAEDGRWLVKSTTPLTASLVSLQRDDTAWVSDADLALSLSAEYTEHRWTWQCAPIELRREGQPILSLETKGASPESERAPKVVSVRWNADLAALTHGGVRPRMDSSTAFRSSGEAVLRLGDALRCEGSVTLTGPEKTDLLSAKLEISSDARRGITIHGPIKAQWASRVSDLTFDGALTPAARSGVEASLSLSGAALDLEHLRLLLGLFHDGDDAPSRSPETKDTEPFWSKALGHVTYAFDRVKIGSTEVKDARGALNLEPKAIRLTYGQYSPSGDAMVPLRGELTFLANEQKPYRLKIEFEPRVVDAGPFFGKPPAGQDAPFEGRVSIKTSIGGTGRTLEDLERQSAQEFEITGKNGIVRLLKTSVDVTQPESSKSADRAAAVGSAVGSFFGMKRTGHEGGSVRLDKKTQAALDLSYETAEFGYNDLWITAKQGTDGVIRVTQFAANGNLLRLKGAGELDLGHDASLKTASVKFELKLGATARIADLMNNAGLSVSAKDGQEFTWLNDAIRIGGTPEQLDISAWHELLAKAATPASENSKAARK